MSSARDYTQLVASRPPSPLAVAGALLLFGGAIAGVTVAVAQALYPGGVDWQNTYRPATLAVLSWASPYTVEIFHSPPWTTFPLIPLAVFPTRIGFGLNFCLSLLVTGFVAYRLGARRITLVAILLSYPVLFSTVYGNVDWLVYLGVVLSPRWGLFLVLTKPQAGMGLAFYWLVEHYRQGGLRRVIEHFAPVSLAFVLSLFLFGPWPLTGLVEVTQPFNASLWPQSLPIGLVMLVAAVRSRRPGLALAASPFLSPYTTASSWGSALLGLLPLQWETLAAVIGIWVLRIFTGYFLTQ
ncbi:MAG: hypothetical protein Q9O62_03910 [Ardenticatenia bacterium]|nr:hypothetical protein [Ardenticatenia bacterium]